jgi:hypothetical protein
MPDSNESVFISAVIWIEELNRLRISPNGLALFEPNPMFFEVGRVLLVVPFEFHNASVFYCIYNIDRKTRKSPVMPLRPSRIIAMDDCGRYRI